MADPWVRPPSPGPPDSGVSTRPDDEVRSSSGKTPSSDDYLLIDRLREDANAGRMDLSSILSEATHAARYFTDATGAALALWSQGVVICRARSGDTAPPLGAKVDVDSGVSGECLRSGRSQRCNDSLTDPRVDPEVCQEMGIRALAAVPLRGGQGVIGILEVFSDRPNAFSDAHITLLKKLAQIAVTGRAKSLAPLPATPKEDVPEPEASAPPRPTVLDRFRFLPERMRGEEGQPLRLVAAALLLILLGFFGWIFSRSRGGTSRSGQAVHAASNAAVPAAMAAGSSTEEARTSPSPTPDNEKRTGTITLGGAGKSPADLVAKDVVQKASTSVVTQRGPTARASHPDEGIASLPATRAPEPANANVDVPAPDSSEVISSMQGNAAPIPQSLVDPHPAFPFVALPVSQGVTGGKLTHKVDPIYPSEARLQRVEGAVVLDALVGEDGNVREVQVTSGPPQLANAATQAVKRWRYQPFQLNGRPVSMHNQITIQFKLP
jgi:TonB family protein